MSQVGIRVGIGDALQSRDSATDYRKRRCENAYSEAVVYVTVVGLWTVLGIGWVGPVAPLPVHVHEATREYRFSVLKAAAGERMSLLCRQDILSRSREPE